MHNWAMISIQNRPKPPVEQTPQIVPFAAFLPIVLQNTAICRRNSPSTVIQSPVCRRLPAVKFNLVYLFQLLRGSRLRLRLLLRLLLRLAGGR